jgi:hypothetical protein
MEFVVSVVRLSLALAVSGEYQDTVAPHGDWLEKKNHR